MAESRVEAEEKVHGNTQPLYVALLNACELFGKEMKCLSDVAQWWLQFADGMWTKLVADWESSVEEKRENLHSDIKAVTISQNTVLRLDEQKTSGAILSSSEKE